MEIGGPLATTILSEGGAAKFSCKFERLVLSEGLHMLDGEDVEASVVSRGRALFAETSIQRYMGRPPCLEDCSWFDFCAWYKQCTSTASASASTCTVAGVDPVELAAHVRAHGLAKVQYPQVPEIIGPRMPDARLIDDEEHADQCELYCRVALLLYCPFRRPTDFLDECGSARRRFEHWDCPGARRCSARSISTSSTTCRSTKRASSTPRRPRTKTATRATTEVSRAGTPEAGT